MPLIRRDPPSTPSAPSDAAALQAPDAPTRFAAARDLSGRPSAVPALAAALAIEPDPGVREAILTGLARVGDAASLAAIAPFIRSDEASLRTAALDALRLMRDALGAHLAALLSDTDPDVRILACDLARHLPAGPATRLLADRLAAETQANVCAAALDVLAELGEPAALPAIEACRTRFADVPFLVFALAVTADRIRGRPAPSRG